MDEPILTGDWVRERREALGWSQVALAEQVGCSLELVRQIELDAARPAPDLQGRLLACLAPVARPAPSLTLGGWMQARRKALDLTQVGLAGAAHCSVATIKKIEAEAGRPSAQLAEQIARVLGVAPVDHPAFVRWARGVAPELAAPTLPAPPTLVLSTGHTGGSAPVAGGARAIRVVLVDDHRLLLEAMQALFAREPDLVVVGVATEGAAALDVIARTAPDVVLMDIHMPGMDGVAATAAIHARWPGVRVIMLTAARDQALVEATIRAGARGYILKDAPTAEAVWAIRGVMVGSSIVTPASLAPLGPIKLPLEESDDAPAG